MLISINPQNPQVRLIRKIVEILQAGGIVVYPTDTYYGIGCDLLHPRAIARIYQLNRNAALKVPADRGSAPGRLSYNRPHNSRRIRHKFPA